ncbi:MAG: tRNA (adenosine(37)-N6)-threonylcarbamoyltransferase complex transferase subunit TsaD [bacterium]|nr:tRNA (adenosine(37)-N6)-threonylcarbamoyltransferase complex transferase subunit TsaD [bacterium]
MKILAIETSCDETAAAVVSKDPGENHVRILSNVIASSLVLHSKTGGIIPEAAAREQLKFIIPVIEKAIQNSKLKIENLDAIAVTMGPGLIGSLLVGVETAKTLSYLWNKPIIPVNHLLGHIYANWLTTSDERPKTISFPALALLVSGGHTDLILMESHKETKWIGGTLDDAAGEAFDKIGRLLSLSYPGGPAIEEISRQGIPDKFIFPRPMIGSKDFNFSFSGLKAAVTREVLKLGELDKQQVADISLAVQKSIIEVLVRKTLKAAKKYNVKSILLGGGVACNQNLHNELELNAKRYTLNAEIFVPQKSLCTDNAAMIGAYATFNYSPTDLQKITANPELYFD